MSVEGGMSGRQKRFVCEKCGKVFFSWRPDTAPGVKVKCYFCKNEMEDEAAKRVRPAPPPAPAAPTAPAAAPGAAPAATPAATPATAPAAAPAVTPAAAPAAPPAGATPAPDPTPTN